MATLTKHKGTPIESLGLGKLASDAMAFHGIRTVEGLSRFTWEKLGTAPKFGVTSMNEVRDKLAERGIRLKGDTGDCIPTSACKRAAGRKAASAGEPTAARKRASPRPKAKRQGAAASGSG